MATSIIRARSMITRTLDRWAYEEHADGALLVEDGVIARIGTYEDLARRYPATPVHGDGTAIMLPGFVNGHHHVGLTPLQMGAPDMPLELWFPHRMAARRVDPYLDTLYAAFEMIGSGITTVQHLNGWMPGSYDEVKTSIDATLRAYRDIGMRVSFSYMVRDQNNIIYQSNDDFIASLPEEMRAPMAASFARTKVGLSGSLDLFRSLFAEYRNDRLIRIALAPANLHWCSDVALEAVADLSRTYGVTLHMHLDETRYQAEYARRRGGGSAFSYLERFGLPGESLTIGHGVWLGQQDIDRIAETGTCICHNCSSNFRLRSGTAPLNRFEAAGITTAIGIDEAGINDDRDMLQEMRLVWRAHRVPGHDATDVPGAAQVLRMATAGGAATTSYRAQIGTLEVGKEADLALFDWQQIAYPYLDSATPTLDALIARARTSGVRLVMCAGRVIYQDGIFAGADRAATLAALHDLLAMPMTEEEQARRRFARNLAPHLKAFYRDYLPDRASAARA